MIVAPERKGLAYSKVVRIGRRSVIIDVAFGLGMRHARRFMSFVGWLCGHWWPFAGHHLRHELRFIIEISNLSVALVVKWIERCEITVGNVSATISGLFTMYAKMP